MALSIQFRPQPAVPVSGPVVYRFLTDDHVLQVGTLSSYVVTVNSPPPPTSSLELGPYTFRFLDLANGYNPAEPLHISLEGSPTAEALAHRILEAVFAHPALTSQLLPQQVANVGGSWLASFTSAAPAPPLNPFLARDPNGLSYSNTTTDPVVGSVTATGQSSVLKEDYTLEVFPEIEARYRQDVNWERLPPLRLVPRLADGTQPIEVDLTGRLAPYLATNLPGPGVTEAYPADQALRKVRIRYAAYQSGQLSTSPAEKRLPDTVNDAPYEFLVLNARLPTRATALQRLRDAHHCPQPITQPDPVGPYFLPDAATGTLLPLQHRVAKTTRPGAPEFYSYFAPENHPHLADPTQLRVVVRTAAGDRTAASLRPTGNSLCEPGQQVGGQVWVLPLQSLWEPFNLVAEPWFEIFVAAPRAGNRFPDANDGTFEGSGGLSNLAITQGAAIGSLQLSSTPVQSGSQAACLSISAPDPNGSPPVVVESGTPVNCGANQRYRLSAWVYVQQNGLGPGEGIEVLPTAPGAELLERTQWIAGTSAEGQWVQLLCVFRYATPTPTRVQFRVGSSGSAVFAATTLHLDQVAFTPLDYSPLVLPRRFVVQARYGRGPSLVHANRWGVPESFHLAGPAEPTFSVETETARLAGAPLEPVSPRAAQEQVWQVAPEQSAEAASLVLQAEERCYLEDLLQAEEHALWEPGIQCAHPVVLEDREQSWRTARANGLRQVPLRWRRAT